MREDEDPRNSVVAWFLVLDRAHEDCDREREEEALRELLRLGLEVRFVGASGAAA